MRIIIEIEGAKEPSIYTAEEAEMGLGAVEEATDGGAAPDSEELTGEGAAEAEEEFGSSGEEAIDAGEGPFGTEDS